jgi:hypothetical protein
MSKGKREEKKSFKKFVTLINILIAENPWRRNERKLR